MITLTFPSNLELDIVTQQYVIRREGMVGVGLMPFQDYFHERVQWDELDFEKGLTPPHAMDADPYVQKRPGSTLREYTGIPFKAAELIKESELLRSRQMGTLGNMINLDAIVTRRMTARIDKDYLTAEYLRWLALTGSMALNQNGVIVNETFPIQTFTSVVHWALPATSTPLHDFDAIKLLFRGTGASAQGARAFMNQTTANQLLENSNAADISGFRSQNFLSLTFSIEEANRIMGARGLPSLEVYDEGYYDANGTFQTFIPDATVIVVGKRPSGERIGELALVPSFHRTINGAPAPGFFSLLTINGQPNVGAGSVSVPQLGASGNPKLEITTGFYGGPLMFYPKSVVKMAV